MLPPHLVRHLHRTAALRIGRAALAAGQPVPALVLLALSCPVLAVRRRVAVQPCGRAACPCTSPAALLALVAAPPAAPAQPAQLSLF